MWRDATREGRVSPVSTTKPRRLDLAHDRTTCTYCPKLCRHACPAAEAERTELATPTFKQQVALLAATGERPLDRDRAAVLWKCTDCAGTVPACRHRVDVAVSLRDAKARAVTAGLAPPEVERARARFAARGSPYDLDLGARLAAAAPLEARATSGQLGLLPSCAALVHEPEGMVRAWRALKEAGRLDARIALPDPACCGYPLDALGLTDAFRLHAARAAASLAGFEELAVQGPACAWTIGVRWREVGVRPRFRSAPLVDLLAQRLPGSAAARAAQATSRAGVRVAYHDPCFLARRLRRTSEPRDVIRALTGASPIDLSPLPEETACSGAGGGYPLTHPGPAKGCAARVVEAFQRAGADLLVTGCPSAARHISKSAPGVKVVSLNGLLPS